jgi:DNA-directed RNA polymerase subunit RPC12/RpoP
VPYAGENASKLGHLTLIQSDWVKDLVAGFERAPSPSGDPSHTPWQIFNPSSALPLSRVWAVDGSFVPVQSTDNPPREVAFVKTALVLLDREQLAEIDPDFPHPLDLRDAMAESGLFHATVFPLRHVRTQMGNNYTSVRHIIRDSIRMDQEGAFYETLKWLAYRRWAGTPSRSPDFQCPHCGEEIVEGLEPDADEGPCPHCGAKVFLTDMPGFHQGMGEDAAPAAIAADYMLVMEHLMLFTPVRLAWESPDSKLAADTLFLKDGPLTLRAQYSKLVEPIRDFLQHSKTTARPIHIVGQEKTGAFVDHLTGISHFAPPHERGEQPAVAVLTHDFVRREVQRMPERSYPYGFKTNWGEKMYLKLDPSTAMVLNVPTGSYDKRSDFPGRSDLIGITRILATLPALVSRRFECGLYPIELANGIASLSSYPSAKVLQRFIEGRH